MPRFRPVWVPTNSSTSGFADNVTCILLVLFRAIWLSGVMTTWDPVQYDRFADERGRPFHELTARIRTSPRTVVDLGCGPGNLTATLAQRWPEATVLGVDNDTSMLTAATAHRSDRVTFEVGDIAIWEPTAPVDVIVTNAALQWIPSHLTILPRLIESLRPGGALALQVPGNFEDAHHLAIREVMSRPQWRTTLSEVRERSAVSYPALVYQSVLARLGCEVDTWETTYVHVLHGDNPVLEWVKGTALRPILSALSASAGQEFCSELSELLLASYGKHTWGTPFPFKRIFAVAHKPN
jgi:trans-aconitate 2-methyltransferase